MKRQQPEQTSATRDEMVRLLNSALSTEKARNKLNIIPAYLFAGLVYANEDHMMWKRPAEVFATCPDSRVTLNTAAVRAWIADTRDSADHLLTPQKEHLSREQLRLGETLYEKLFIDSIQYVPWSTFLDRIRRVTVETVAAINAARVANPNRITLVVLGEMMNVDSSNAWLIGLIWRQLAPITDFIIENGAAGNTFMQTLLAIAQQQASSAVDDAPDSDDQRRVANFLSALQIDLIYVDDMIYSGEQAGYHLFSDATTFSADYLRRCTVNLLVPYMTEKGFSALNKEKGACALRVPPSTLRVSSYGATVAPLIEQVKELFIIPFVIQTLAEEKKSAIVFEHKCADNLSLPRFVGTPALPFEGGFFAAWPAVARKTTAFYKTPAFRWRLRRKRDNVLFSFTEIETLFAALRMEYTASPPCAHCATAIVAPLRCGGCGVLPYCSAACHAAYAATPIGRRHAHWCRRLAALAGTLQ